MNRDVHTCTDCGGEMTARYMTGILGPCSDAVVDEMRRRDAFTVFDAVDDYREFFRGEEIPELEIANQVDRWREEHLDPTPIVVANLEVLEDE